MNNFIKSIIGLYVIVYLVLLLLYNFDVITTHFLSSSIYAGLLNLINAFLAVKLFNISYKKGGSSFMIYNLGGLGIRLMFLLIAFVVIIKFLNIDKYGFILVFFLFYFISLFFEVIFYLKKSNKLT